MFDTKAMPKGESRKFGTFLGVFVPCILMLFGVIIFLRMGWIVGAAGVAGTFGIISFSTLIVLITAFSIATISTNAEIGKGGVYYMLSRSLGIELGSAIGIPLFLKQTLSIAFCTIGFAESLHELIPSWSITNIGAGTLVILTFLAYTSIRGALKVQVGIFIILIASLLSLFLGDKIDAPSDTIPTASFGFWPIFALFFPAMTGIESSVSLSGDLRNPSRSLPIGIITAILVAYAVYAGIAIFLGSRASSELLVQDPLIIQKISKIPSLIIVGIWGATLSSALGGLLGAPRTLQSLAEDGIVPKIFGKTFGPMDEPRIATLTTCVIAVAATYLGSINVIAPLLTMICLICYGVLNLSAGIETLMGNPSWRPRFRVHWGISMFGAVLCLATMLVIDAKQALVALGLVALIHVLIKRRQLEGSWSDIRQGIWMFFSRSAIYRLASEGSLSKSWRPHFLVFTKSSEKHSSSLLKFSQAISQSKGFLTMASFIPKGEESSESRKARVQALSETLKTKNIESFIQIKEAESITSGMRQMIEHYGIGSIVPNTIVFGGIKKEDETTEFVSVLQSADKRKCNIIIMNDKNEIQEPQKGEPKKEIHVWWDSEHHKNSELMLVVAYMLQQNPAWKNTLISLKAIVSSELEKQDKLSQLKRLSISKRFNFGIEILVSNTPSASLLTFVKEFSKNAELVLIGLAPPPKVGASVYSYIDYLHTADQATQEIPSLALVYCSHHTPLEDILL